MGNSDYKAHFWISGDYIKNEVATDYNACKKIITKDYVIFYDKRINYTKH